MTYQYVPSKAEIAAEKMLRDKGWIVDRPRCPECHGIGFVNDYEIVAESKSERFISYNTRTCPNGCPPAMMFFNAGLPVS